MESVLIKELFQTDSDRTDEVVLVQIVRNLTNKWLVVCKIVANLLKCLDSKPNVDKNIARAFRNFTKNICWNKFPRVKIVIVKSFEPR